jgi:phenylacetate-CoA ligase
MTVPGGGMGSEERIRRLLELGATVLVCTPTYARRLATVAQEMGIDPARESKVRLLIHAGEPGAQVPATKKMLQELWGAKAGDFPGMSETGGSTSYECAEQCGGNHILEDHYIQEVVEPGGTKRLGYGEKGEMVLTSFGREAIPLIRYRTGDLVQRVESRFCPCGRTFDLYLGGILGRADDMKVVRGVNIFPTTVENIVRGFPEVGEFELVIFEKGGDDLVKLRVEVAPSLGKEGYERLEAALARELYVAHSMKFEVEALPPGSLPQFELKAKRLRDLRGQGGGVVG